MDINTSRVTRKKTEARSNYNRLSRWYDLISGSEEVFRQTGVQLLDPQKGELVLEIGFGTASCLVSFAEAVGENGRVTGIDLSDGMIGIAKERISRNLADERIDLCLADGAQLPFCYTHFHAIFLSFTLELFDSPEIPKVLEQCARILVPGGRLVNVSLARTPEPGSAERIYEWFHALMPVLIDCRPIDAHNALVEAGFEIRENRRMKMWGLPVDVISAILNPT